MNNGPTLSFGMFGSDVRRLQRILVSQMMITYSNLTGVYNTQTRASIRQFQENMELPITGIVDNATWHKLPADTKVKNLTRGSSGVKVRALQTGLKRLGIPGTDPGAIDGVFGAGTENAVYAYQNHQGIYRDGVVGDQTWWIPAGGAGATLASLCGLSHG